MVDSEITPSQWTRISEMPRDKPEKKAAKLRHEPLQRQIEHKNGKLKEPKTNRNQSSEDNNEEEEHEEITTKGTLKSTSRVTKDSDMAAFEDWGDDEEGDEVGGKFTNDQEEEEEYDEEEGDEEEEFVELDGENFAAAGVSESEVLNYSLSHFVVII